MTLQTNYLSYDTPQFSKLSDDQRQRIHYASLEILERTGARLYEQEAVDLLKKAGAYVSDGNLVRIPSSLVERALAMAPKRVTLCNREGHRVMPIEGQNVFYGPGSDCLNVIDLYSGERRRATLEDVANGVRLCDALPNIDFVMSFCAPSDVDQRIFDRYQMRAMLLNSTKPIIFVTTGFEGCVDAIEMAEIVAGGEEALRYNPLCACYINVTAPLRHNAEALQKLLFLAEKRLPSIYIPVVLRGLNGPVTVAGAIALANAGELVGVVLSQLKMEGAPIIVSGGTNDVTDMRTMVGVYAAPENRVMFMEMAHYYHLPMFGTGGVSDSKLPDEQAAAEVAMTLLTETLCGANLIHDVGYLESGLTNSFEMMVICDELIGWIKRFMQGLEVNEETLALDLIDEVGPDGQYLDKAHTLQHFREDWYPRLIDRQNYDGWLAAGGKTLRQRANEKVRRILEEHQPEPWPADIIARIDGVVRRAEAQLP